MTKPLYYNGSEKIYFNMITITSPLWMMINVTNNKKSFMLIYNKSRRMTIMLNKIVQLTKTNTINAFATIIVF